MKNSVKGIRALPVRGGGSKPLPGWFGATFLGRICLILGGLDPCPYGLGHFFPRWSAPECPFECGGGVQWLNGQCPNAFCAIFGGASLTPLWWGACPDTLCGSDVSQFIELKSNVVYRDLWHPSQSMVAAMLHFCVLPALLENLWLCNVSKWRCSLPRWTHLK